MGPGGANGRWAGVAVVAAVVTVVVVWDPLGGVVRWVAGALPEAPRLPWADLPQPLAFLLGPGKVLSLLVLLALADALRRRRGSAR